MSLARLLALLRLDVPLLRARIALDEGALAAEDRVQLVRMAWEEDKQRLKLMFALALSLLGLTILAVAMLSIAVIVHFWDTPGRVTAAWCVAAFWSVLCAAVVGWLLTLLGRDASAFDSTRRELGRDWAWLQSRMGWCDDEESPAPRPATQQELLVRIARQRERIALLTVSPAAATTATAEPGGNLSRAEAAVELVRAHPVVAGVAAAAVVAAVGPRRIIRWGAWLLPLLLRNR